MNSQLIFQFQFIMEQGPSAVQPYCMNELDYRGMDSICIDLGLVHA